MTLYTIFFSEDEPRITNKTSVDSNLIDHDLLYIACNIIS